MADADPFTSNGTCYYASGKKADPVYIPCGNDVFGTVPCCQAGDYCLSNNACFNNQFGNVYLAGCTSGDAYNNEEACPRKYKLDAQQWVGMVRCHQSNDIHKADEIWQGCHESIQPLNTIGDSCECTTGLGDGLYTKAPPDLPREGLLPTKLGGFITFASGWGPSNTHVTATSKVNLTELTIETPPPTPVSGWSTLSADATDGGGVAYTGGPGGTSADGPGGGGGSTLSTGAKAGIGVGAAVAGLALIGILWCLFRLNRRVARAQANPAYTATPNTPMSPASATLDHHYGYVPSMAETPKPQPAATEFAHPSELEGSHYQTMGAELPADNTGAYEAQAAHASPNPSHIPSPGLSDAHGTSEAGYPYSADRGSVVSSVRSSDYNPGGYLSPQGQGDESGQGHHGRNGSRGQVGGMDAIHELDR